MISIIMPVYNGEKTIGNSIKSILNQSNSDWELLIVDNGSQDNTLRIVLEYEKQDDRIKIFSCTEPGVVYARSMGLRYAKGNYIAFLDADDQFKSEALDKIQNIIQLKNYDIISFGYDIVSEAGNIEPYKPRSSGEITDVEFFEYLFQVGTLGFLWNKVYRADIIRQAQTPYGMEVCEDLYMNCYMLMERRDIYVLQENLYLYFANTESITRTMKKKITESGEWKYYLAYTQIEKMCQQDAKKKRCIQSAKLVVLKLGEEELLSENGFYNAKKKMIKYMIKNIPKVWISKNSLRFKFGYFKTLVLGVLGGK